MKLSAPLGRTAAAFACCIYGAKIEYGAVVELHGAIIVRTGNLRAIVIKMNAKATVRALERMRTGPSLCSARQHITSRVMG